MSHDKLREAFIEAQNEFIKSLQDWWNETVEPELEDRPAERIDE